jgi:hypothetical protein
VVTLLLSFGGCETEEQKAARAEAKRQEWIAKGEAEDAEKAEKKATRMSAKECRAAAKAFRAAMTVSKEHENVMTENCITVTSGCQEGTAEDCKSAVAYWRCIMDVKTGPQVKECMDKYPRWWR